MMKRNGIIKKVSKVEEDNWLKKWMATVMKKRWIEAIRDRDKIYSTDDYELLEKLRLTNEMCLFQDMVVWIKKDGIYFAGAEITYNDD